MASSEAAAAQRRAAGQPSSPYAGVHWAKKERRWKAEIYHEGRYQRLGTFAEEEAAARAFDEAARRLRGDKAHGGRQGVRGKIRWLNFPTEAEAAAAPVAQDPDGKAVDRAKKDQTQVRNVVRRLVTDVERQIKREAHASKEVGNAVKRLVADVERAAKREARRVPRQLAPAEEVIATAEATVAQRRAAGQPASRYAGVCWFKSGRRWKATINHEGRRQHLGSFAEEVAAARAFDEAARRLRGDEAHGGVGARGAKWRLNFPTGAEAAAAPEEDEPADEEVVAAAEAAVAQRRAARQPASRYVGVSWAKEQRRWRAEIQHEGRLQRLGTFVKEEAAARAYDDAARRLRGDKAHGGRANNPSIIWRLNFPTEVEAAAAPDEDEPADEGVLAAAEAVVAQRRAVGQPASRYVGVSWCTKVRRWRATIKHEGRRQHLGTFAEEEAAARAFDDAARRLRGDQAHGGRASKFTRPWRLNFPIEAEAAAADE
eukprot:COSAG04_NODE_999_length_8849_cov_3.214286_10_plen_486_part_00